MHSIAKNQFAYDNGAIDKQTYSNLDTGFCLELEDLRRYMRFKEMDDIPGDEVHTYAFEAVRRRQDAHIELRTDAELQELRSKWELMDKLKAEDIALERARYTKEISVEAYFQKKEELLDKFMPAYNFCMSRECVDMVKLAGMES
jgi:hypothetical protein